MKTFILSNFINKGDYKKCFFKTWDIRRSFKRNNAASGWHRIDDWLCKRYRYSWYRGGDWLLDRSSVLGSRSYTRSSSWDYEMWIWWSESEKIWCGYLDDNTKFKRAQEKCGFRYHHTKENVLCALEGVFRTEHLA